MPRLSRCRTLIGVSGGKRDGRPVRAKPGGLQLGRSDVAAAFGCRGDCQQGSAVGEHEDPASAGRECAGLGARTASKACPGSQVTESARPG